MNFSQEIINVLDYLCKRFGIVIDWTSENVMPYLEDLCARYIQFEIKTSIAWIALCVGVMALAGIIWIISGIVNACICSDITEGIKYVSMFFFWLFLVMSIIVGMFQAYDIIECYTLPEKVVFEYLESLIQSSSR
jgi:hypothetical protein